MKKLITICAVLVLMAVTTSMAYAEPLPSDNFDDNTMDTMLWTLYEDDHGNAWLDETDGRLELQSTADVEDSAAVYFANGWGLSTADNFSLKIDFHSSSTSGPYPSGFDIMFGIGKGIDDLETIRDNSATIGASHYLDEETNYPFFYYCVTTDGIDVADDDEERTTGNGTLYISYDAGEDELYLSLIDYGTDSAWVTIEGLLQGDWGCDIVSPFLGGWVDNRALASGDAYLDNFVVDTGNIIPEPATICLLGLGALSLIRRKK